MTADQRSKVINAGADFFVFDNNAQGAMIAKVVGRGGVKTIYNVAKLTYKVAPSKTTRQNLLTFRNMSMPTTTLKHSSTMPLRARNTIKLNQ